MTDPRSAEAIEWDDGNESELAGHAIFPEEVEQLWRNRPTVLPNRTGRSGDFKLVGRTDGGRALTVIVSYDSTRRCLRPITGWGCTAGEMTRYLN